MRKRLRKPRPPRPPTAPEVPSGLLATLPLLPETAILLIRHADRPSEGNGRAVPITDRGAERAFRLGEALGDRLARAASSTALRCHQTARSVLAGAGRDAPVLEHDVLGMSGPFVSDIGRAMTLSDQLGRTDVVRKLIAGEPLSGMRSLADGTAILLALARMRLGPTADPTRTPDTGLTLWVSHDAIVMPIIAACTGDRFDERWLAPLDGAALWMDEGQIVMGWAGNRYPVG